jgi:hypothetical protein
MSETRVLPRSSQSPFALGLVPLLVGALMAASCGGPSNPATAAAGRGSPSALATTALVSGDLMVSVLPAPHQLDLLRIDATTGEATPAGTIRADLRGSELLFVGGDIVVPDGNNGLDIWNIDGVGTVTKVPGCGRVASGFGTGEGISDYGPWVQGADRSAWALCDWGTFKLQAGRGTGDALPGSKPWTSYGEGYTCFGAAATLSCIDSKGQVDLIDERGGITHGPDVAALLAGTEAAPAPWNGINPDLYDGHIFFLTVAAERTWLVQVDAGSWQVTKIVALPASMGTDVGLWGGGTRGGLLLFTWFGIVKDLFPPPDPRDTAYFVDAETMKLTAVEGYKPVGGGLIVTTAKYAFYVSGKQEVARFDPSSGETTLLHVPMGKDAWISALNVIP